MTTAVNASTIIDCPTCSSTTQSYCGDEDWDCYCVDASDSECFSCNATSQECDFSPLDTDCTNADNVTGVCSGDGVCWVGARGAVVTGRAFKKGRQF
jgi:hypothetical protein